MLSNKERERYQRHLLIDGFGESSQLKLKNASVLIVGAGGLGCPIIQYLVAGGIGNIGIIDADVVSLSNLQRQILFAESEVGEYKAEVAMRKMKDLNSEIELRAYTHFLTEENASDTISNYDIVIGATDNFESRYLIDETCAKLSKYFVHGSILEYEGQVSIFSPGQTLRYADLFSKPEQYEDLSLGVMGTLPGIIGSIMASETIKLVSGFGDTLCGKLLLYDAKKNTQSVLAIS